jgi:hypothetical protein
MPTPGDVDRHDPPRLTLEDPSGVLGAVTVEPDVAAQLAGDLWSETYVIVGIGA